MTTYQLVGVSWFILSIVVEVFGNLALLIWLKRQGVRLTFGLRGIPGYQEYVYFNWCKSEGRSSVRILVLRGISLANLIIAAIVIIPMIVAANSK